MLSYLRFEGLVFWHLPLKPQNFLIDPSISTIMELIFIAFILELKSACLVVIEPNLDKNK
jgi:hypothetical protein